MQPETETALRVKRKEGRMRRILSVIRTIVGMPDYDRYLEHCRLRHPDQPILSQSDYFAQFVARRYGSGASRCC